jgi:hypothetical protein
VRAVKLDCHEENAPQVGRESVRLRVHKVNVPALIVPMENPGGRFVVGKSECVAYHTRAIRFEVAWPLIIT